MRFARPVLAGVLALGVLTACTPAPSSPASSAAGSEAPSPSAAAEVECPPIELRLPNGSLIDLSGIWIQDAGPSAVPMKWWIRSLGDCFWASGIADSYTEEEFFARPDSVQTMRGTVRDDFTVDGIVVLLGPHPDFASPPYQSTIRLFIDIGQGGESTPGDPEITLREDREPGVQGPRCPDPVGYCPAPLVLRRQPD
jgi:hypothetical protein